MEQPEVIVASTATVMCDGGTGALGHPAVYLRFKEALEVVCPYCSRRFQLAQGAERVARH